MELQDDLVRCPNYCHDGLIKILDLDRALYSLGKCPYCAGLGKVTKEKALIIDKLL